jgi:hypothetical protein
MISENQKLAILIANGLKMDAMYFIWMYSANSNRMGMINQRRKSKQMDVQRFNIFNKKEKLNKIPYGI